MAGLPKNPGIFPVLNKDNILTVINFATGISDLCPGYTRLGRFNA
jgi:hypothetical protein